jgi:hypothetical protein
VGKEQKRTQLAACLTGTLRHTLHALWMNVISERVRGAEVQ